MFVLFFVVCCFFFVVVVFLCLLVLFGFFFSLLLFKGGLGGVASVDRASDISRRQLSNVQPSSCRLHKLAVVIRVRSKKRFL